MSYSRGGRSTSPRDYFSPGRASPSRSLSRSRRSRSRSNSVDATNPRNDLFVTGRSTRDDASDPEKQFSSERKMSYSREGRSTSPRDYFSPDRGRPSRSLPRSRRSRSRSKSVDASNPGNNLYVTGLSTRVGTSDLEKYFSSEGKVLECQLVTDPRTRESRGFGFVTMETVDDAERCIKYLNRSVFEGRLITVEKWVVCPIWPVSPVKAKRKRGRTPTPGRYQGLKDTRGQGRRRSRSYSPRSWQNRDTGYSRDHRGRSRSPYRHRPDDYSDSYRRRNNRYR